jgi:hypothetical protein
VYRDGNKPPYALYNIDGKLRQEFYY